MTYKAMDLTQRIARVRLQQFRAINMDTPSVVIELSANNDNVHTAQGLANSCVV